MPLLALLGACGAGVATGIVLGSDRSSSSTPPAAPLVPAISLPVSQGPLFLLPPPEQVFTVRAILNNIDIPPNVDVRVELQANGQTSVQLQPELSQQVGSDPVVSFFLRTEEIKNSFLPDLFSQDVEAELQVFFDDVPVSPEPARFLLLRQPEASLAIEPGAPDQALLSTSGGTRIRLRVKSLPDGLQSGLLVDIATPNPNGLPGAVVTPCGDVVLFEDPLGEGTIVECTTPPSRFPTNAAVRIEDAKAGVSNAIVTVFYVPTISAAVPRRASARGGDLVNLTGDGLIPLDLTVPGQPRLDFGKVQVVLRRGQRDTVLGLDELRPQLSSLSNIVFVSPPSPDGRPGPAEILLRVSLPFNVETVARSIFTYGVSQPEFGPLGQGLKRMPIGIVAENLRPLSPGREIPVDIALLNDPSGVPELDLLQSQGNGVFLPLESRVPAAAVIAPEQRNPASFAAGDFNQDGKSDLFILNRGNGVSAAHSMVLGDNLGGAPTVLATGTQPGTADSQVVRSGDLDEDGNIDLAILRAPGLEPAIEVLLTRTWVGSPSFASSEPLSSSGDVLEAMDLIDMDGDGHLDIIAAGGGLQPVLITAYGRGDGSFEGFQRLDIQSAEFTPEAGSRVIGVHGAFPGSPGAIAVIMSGGDDLVTSPPAVLVMPGIAARVHGGPDDPGGGTLSLLSADAKIAVSMAADMDLDGIPELVFGFDAPTARPLRLLHWISGSLVELPGNVDLRGELVTRCQSLEFGLAVTDDPPGTKRVPAVFLAHEAWVDGQLEARVSTLLVGPGPWLLSPIARKDISEEIRSMHLVSNGDQSDQEASDLAVILEDRIKFLNSDGLGGLFDDFEVMVPGLLEETVIPVQLDLPQTSRESQAFLIDDGRLAVLYSEGQSMVYSPDLRRALPSALRSIPVSGRSRIIQKDVDQDGLLDLVVLLHLSLSVTGAEDQAAVLLFPRDGPIVTLERLPFKVPDLTLPQQLVHGASSSMVLADFAADGLGSPLELALAIPEGVNGDEIRFYRYSRMDAQIPDDDRFLRSFANSNIRALSGGFGPRVLSSGDMDGNGSEDLIVAAEDESSILVFLHNGLSILDKEEEVNVGAFNLSSSDALPPGEPRAIIRSDYDGDGIGDYMVHVRDVGVETRHAVAVYISDGIGRFVQSHLLPATRVGDKIPRMDSSGLFSLPRNAELQLAVSDMNMDGSVDLLLAWGPDRFGLDGHIRILFGGYR